MIRMGDLSDAGIRSVIKVGVALGVDVQWSARARIGFLLEYVDFSRGVLTYCTDTPVDSVLHELAHIAFLSPENRAVWDQPNIPTNGRDDGRSDEQVIMCLQIEFARRVRGYGIRRALENMVRADYAMGAGPESIETTATASRWWRAVKKTDHYARAAAKLAEVGF